MAMTSDYLALDLGAESGRGLLGRFDGEQLVLEEIHRFPNGPVKMLDTLYWDLPRLFEDLKTALGKAAAPRTELDGIGVDTWGVDFGLVGRGDTLLGNPVHYRDARTEGMLQAAFEKVSRERIYEITGLQFMPFNTIYQLLALKQANSPILDVAETLLMMPDLLGWLLTGRRAGERTDASTTQLLDAAERNLVDRAVPGPRFAAWDFTRADRAGQRAWAAAQVGHGGSRDGAARDSDRSGHARHRKCRGRRARFGLIVIIRATRLVLSQFGNMVAARCGSFATCHQCGNDAV